MTAVARLAQVKRRCGFSLFFVLFFRLLTFVNFH